MEPKAEMVGVEDKAVVEELKAETVEEGEPKMMANQKAATQEEVQEVMMAIKAEIGEVDHKVVAAVAATTKMGVGMEATTIKKEEEAAEVEAIMAMVKEKVVAVAVLARVVAMEEKEIITRMETREETKVAAVANPPLQKGKMETRVSPVRAKNLILGLDMAKVEMAVLVIENRRMILALEYPISTMEQTRTRMLTGLTQQVQTKTTIMALALAHLDTDWESMASMVQLRTMRTRMEMRQLAEYTPPPLMAMKLW